MEPAAAADGKSRAGEMGGHVPPKIRGEDAAWLSERIAAGPFTLRGLVAELLAVRGLKVDYRTMWSFVRAEGLSFKKNRGGGGAGAA